MKGRPLPPRDPALSAGEDGAASRGPWVAPDWLRTLVMAMSTLALGLLAGYLAVHLAATPGVREVPSAAPVPRSIDQARTRDERERASVRVAPRGDAGVMDGYGY